MSPILNVCSTEFSEHNQRGISWAVRRAYDVAASKTDPDKHQEYGTPLRPSIRGSIRWNNVQFFLQEACTTGRIVGFSPIWRPTGGKSPCNQVLELVGTNVCLTAVHTSDLESHPRDATFRRDARGSNQMLLEGIEEPQPTEAAGKVNLLIVHGAHEFEFAEIRCYHGGEDNPSAYTTVIANLERWRDDDGGTIEPVDQEPITPPVIELRNNEAAEADVSGK